MSAREKLIEQLMAFGLSVPSSIAEPLADHLLAAGFTLPEPPPVDKVEKEAERLFDLTLQSRRGTLCYRYTDATEPAKEVWRILATDSLARQAEAFVAGVQARCHANDWIPCHCLVGTRCGDLKQSARERYGPTKE